MVLDRTHARCLMFLKRTNHSTYKIKARYLHDSWVRAKVRVKVMVECRLALSKSWFTITQ